MTGSNITFRRFYLLSGVVLSAWYLLEQNSLAGRRSWLIAGFLALNLLLFGLTEIRKIYLPTEHLPVFPRPVAWALCLLLQSTPLWITYFFSKTVFQQDLERILFLLFVSGISAWVLRGSLASRSISTAFVISMLAGGLIYRLGLFLPDLSTSLFSRGWSEGSRYFNASLFFSQALYGERLPLPVLHPTRYLLQALPFLFAPQQILVHRVWQVLLWVGFTGAGAVSLAKRFSGSRLFLTGLSAWLFLFFFQGAVYYHLMVCALLIFAGFDSKKPLRTLWLVIAASLWAGVSRLNWMPVPALLAVALYLLENPAGKQNLFRYLAYPTVWCIVGAVSALAANRVYIALSGNDAALFSSSLQSYMLWHRLLPNATYPLGILLGVLIVSLPPALLVLQRVIQESLIRKIHWLRWLGLAGILAVFLVGGIIVSVKVGGGGDLHNLDAFLVFWACISLYFALGKVKLESEQTFSERPAAPAAVLLAALVPVILMFTSSATYKAPDRQNEQREIAILQAVVDTANQQSGTPLFISETQLLTFGVVKDVTPIPEYEKVFLMEMVMSQNERVLGPLHQQFADQAFSVIITDTIWAQAKNVRSSFGIENNLWVDEIVVPMLSGYEPILSLEKGAVHVLVPIGQKALYQAILDDAPAKYLISE